jgi:hypothetical protein
VAHASACRAGTLADTVFSQGRDVDTARKSACATLHSSEVNEEDFDVVRAGIKKPCPYERVMGRVAKKVGIHFPRRKLAQNETRHRKPQPDAFRIR